MQTTRAINIKMPQIIIKMVKIQRKIITMIMMMTITMKCIRIREKIGLAKEEDLGAEVEVGVGEACMEIAGVEVGTVITEEVVGEVGEIGEEEVVVVGLRVIITAIEMVVALTTNQREISIIRVAIIKSLTITEFVYKHVFIVILYPFIQLLS